MPTTQLDRQTAPERPMDEARDLVPVVGAVFQAGPPAYALAATGAVITLLACSPLVILAAVLMISLAVTAIVAAAVVLPVLMLRRIHELVTTHRSAEPRAARDLLRSGLAGAPTRTRSSLGLATSRRTTR